MPVDSRSEYLINYNELIGNIDLQDLDGLRRGMGKEELYVCKWDGTEQEEEGSKLN